MYTTVIITSRIAAAQTADIFSLTIVLLAIAAAVVSVLLKKNK